MEVNECEANKLRQHYGFVLSLIKSCAVVSGEALHNESLPFVRQAVSRLKGEPGEIPVRDAFSVAKKLKRGVSSRFFLHNAGHPVDFDAVSRIATDLRINALHFPAFFVFVTRYDSRRGRDYSNEELHQLREQLGQRLVTAFAEKYL